MDATVEKIVRYQRETALLGSINSLLAWDERTGLPEQAGEYRAEQMSFLAGLVHDRKVSPQFGEWLHEARSSNDFSSWSLDERTVVLELQKEFEKQKRLPRRLVEELSRAEVIAQQQWVVAREKDDFATFAPYLEKNIALRREYADAIGFKETRYDALIDDYEPGETYASLANVIIGLRKELVPLVAKINASSKKPDDSILHREFPVGQQEKFGKRVAAEIGFDFTRGRLDVTTHPFCTEIGPHDHRILTRYNERFFNESFFGILHEAGHGMYDQGLRPEWYGLPPGTFVSLGIHESQSRMWENLVGRSLPFWEHYLPLAKEYFPASLKGVSPLDFYRAANTVEASLIRVEADEVTYNLHIAIRFELEAELINGKLQVQELPQAWNEKYREYLGIVPPSNKLGVLQDVHWSACLFGYFPTYLLGNIYAGQLFAAAKTALGDLEGDFRKGEFSRLKNWLVQNVHAHGQNLPARKLVVQASGKELSHADLMDYLTKKFGAIYEF